MYEELIEFYNKKKNNIKRYYENSNEAKQIRNLTSFLDSSNLFKEISYKQRIWHLVNNHLSLKLCVCCGNPVRWDYHNKQYLETCCKECAIKYSKSDIVKNKIFSTNIKKYGSITYSQTEECKQKQKQTCLEKYGVDNPAKSDDYSIKSKKTCLEKYGVDNYAQTEEYKEKSKQTSLEKYGVESHTKLEKTKENLRKLTENTFKNEEFKKKSKQTCLEKYGVDNPAKSDDYSIKSKKTCLEKYGVEYISQVPEIRKKQEESNKKTCLEKYGTKYYSQSFNYIDNVVEKHFRDILKRDGYEQQGYKYIGYKQDSIHEIYCPKCKKNFLINSGNSYFFRRKNNQEICTNCNPLEKFWSNDEKELLDYIKSIYSGEIIENNRKIIYPYELDIYLPELNLAIEYNGLFWHSSEKVNKNYHKMKSNLCKEKGIHLIHIFEDDWRYKQEICKSILSNFINPSNNQKIYARKCIIKEISFNETNDFLIKNHLLGSISSFSRCHGLYFNDELVSLMSFRLISKETNQYELNRYAIKKYTTIIGGAERLFKQFISNNQFSSIITYNDNSIFKGNIYPKLGFKYIRTNSPNYMFVINSGNSKMRINKQSIRKLKIGYSIEKEKELGLIRIYNAGNDVYIHD